MIKIDSYAHSVMMNFFERVMIAAVATAAAYYVNESFGDVVYLPGVLYMLYVLTSAWQKIINPLNWYKNCWYKGGK